MAKEDGSVVSEQYDIDVVDGHVLVKDKVNNEVTEVLGDAPHYSLREYIEETPNNQEEVPTELPTSLEDVQLDANINSKVTWRNELGEVQVGTLTEVLGDIATVVQDGVSMSMPLAMLTPVDVMAEEPESRQFARFTDDGKIIMRVGNYDIELDTDNQIVLVLDENVTFPFDSKAPMGKALKEIKANMKKAGLKGFSNLNKFSVATQRMFGRSVDEEEASLYAKLDQLKIRSRKLTIKISKLDKTDPDSQSKLEKLENEQDIIELKMRMIDNKLRIIELKRKNKAIEERIEEYKGL
jgi:hypothetical protein